MNIFVYSDESGVLDNRHQKWYVFAGIVFLSKEDRDNTNRKYISSEHKLRKSYRDKSELKGNTLAIKHKRGLYRSLNHIKKFGVAINQSNIEKNVFNNKKSKQRFLDYTYKIGIKRFFEHYITTNKIKASEVENIFFFVDEHSTATDGQYELEEALRLELKIGRHNYNWNEYFPPLFPNAKNVSVQYCRSEKHTLVRASDIVANNLFYKLNNNKPLPTIDDNFIITYLP